MKFTSRGKALGLMLCMLAINCGMPVVARAAPPAAIAKSRAFDGKVEIDPRLRRHPKLGSFLLKEGRRALEAQKKEADDTRRSDPRSFGRTPWSFHRIYRLRSETEQYVSLVRIEHTYTGGAHPNTSVTTMLWDRAGERTADIFDLFADTRAGGSTLTAVAGLVREALAREKKKRGNEVDNDPAKDEWLKAVEADKEKVGQPSLAPSIVAEKSSGMTFHFSPYEVGPYVEGGYTAFVPATALASLLKPDARTLFAGQRPANDTNDAD